MALRIIIINLSTYYIVPGPSTVGKDHLMTINGTAISASSFDRILNQEWLDDMVYIYEVYNVLLYYI